jgi:DNA adenine methylase
MKPLLKWVGGKTQILDTVFSHVPNSMNNYHEIFLGGGSVLLRFLQLVHSQKITVHGKIYASDLNPTLISFYKNVQTNYRELFDETMLLQPDEKTQTHEEFYYSTRSAFNSMTMEEKSRVKGSAVFLYLNKTCFRGMYREGPNGFNVPFGHYKNPTIVELSHIQHVSELIRSVTFECLDFNERMRRIAIGDFAYLDPPYVAEKKTSFVKYNAVGFDQDVSIQLFSIVKTLMESGVHIAMSNSDVPLVKDWFLFAQIKTILCKRSINSKNPGSKTNEVLIVPIDRN